MGFQSFPKPELFNLILKIGINLMDYKIGILISKTYKMMNRLRDYIMEKELQNVVGIAIITFITLFLISIYFFVSSKKESKKISAKK